MMLKSASGLSATSPSRWCAQRRSGNRRQQELRNGCFGAAERKGSGGLRQCVSLLLCDMAADVDCRRWSLVVREKSTVPSRRLKFSGFCVWKFCVRMGQRAWSNQRGALTLNPPHFGLGDRSISAGQLISSLKALCRTAWSQSPVTFGFDLGMLHRPLRQTARSQLQPAHDMGTTEIRKE